MFSEEKVTHMASYLLMKRGGRMSYMKLIKLLYLAERKALAKWGESMSGDKFVSMPYGPVMSNTYGLIQTESKIWDSFIKSEANKEISLASGISEDDLDELSRSELRILDDIFSEFGHLSRWDLVEYTHDHCAEWQDPNGSSYPINPIAVLRAQGLDSELAHSLIEHGEEQRGLDQIKQSIRA